jgi:hypothetical protein
MARAAMRVPPSAGYVMRLANPVQVTQSGIVRGASTWLQGPATARGCAAFDAAPHARSAGTRAYDTSGYRAAAAA